MNRELKPDSKLIKALIEVQGVLMPIPSNRDNPFADCKYLDLPAILQVAKPILSEHKVLMQQTVDIYEDEKGQPRAHVMTELLNLDGELISCDGDLGPTEMGHSNSTQKIGATASYLRRFQAMAVLGLSGTEDDDESNFRPRKTDDTADETPPAQRQPLEGAAEVAELRNAVKDLAESKLFTDKERIDIKTMCMNMREKAPLMTLLADVQETTDERTK